MGLPCHGDLGRGRAEVERGNAGKAEVGRETERGGGRERKKEMWRERGRLGREPVSKGDLESLMAPRPRRKMRAGLYSSLHP